MKHCKVIITLLLAFAMLFCIIVPVGASDYTSQISTFWEQWMHNLASKNVLGDIPGLLCSQVCTSSTDGLHHCTSLDNATLANTGHDDKGWYCNCTCAYCGKTFRAYSSDFEHAYNTYVTTLPAAGFGRDGSGDDCIYLYYNPTSFVQTSQFNKVSFSGGINFSFSATNSIGSNIYCRLTSAAAITAPCSGFYSYFYNISSSGVNEASLNTGYSSLSGHYTLSAGTSLTNDCYFSIMLPTWGSGSVSGSLGWKCVPSDTSYVSINYPTSSRVNTVINNYSVKNEDNTYNYITNKPIFDENTLVFFNPLTGVSFNVTCWYYDYSNRRYVLTYSDDKSVTQTSTVEYGDNNITVTTGTTINNYYYIVPDTSCKHTYVVSNSLSPTCTASGSKTYTCSKCNDTYTETIPALGHNWVKGETVATTYEADGTTVKTRGYTLYTCSRCGEKYFDYDGSGPPVTTDSTPTFNWLQRIYYKLVDILNAVLGIDTSITVNTASDTDIQINVPGANGEEDKKWSLNDMKAKFGWLHEIHTIIGTFVSDITSDSDNAYAMAASVNSLDVSGSVPISGSSSTSSAPSIAIDFGAAKSVYGYNYGAKYDVLDLSWYSAYKPTVDAILSGFLWLLFLWGVFKHAPGIIGGGDLMDNHIEKFKGGRKS